jgi:DNA polymerase III delta prime subunit
MRFGRSMTRLRSKAIHPMGDPAVAQLDHILRSGAAADWKERLTAAFFDTEARRAIIHEIREAIATDSTLEDPAALESIRHQVVRHLVGLASRDARPLEPAPAARSSTNSGHALEDRIVTTYPYPIAKPYRTMIEQDSAAGAFGCLLDVFEGMIHYLATVVVSAYLRGSLSSPDCNSHLLSRLVKQAWATGDLMSLLRDTVRHAGDFEGRLPYLDLPGHLFDDRGGPTASLRVLESFVSLRNRVWGHGTGRDEEFFASILVPNRARLELELAMAPWLASWELVRPLTINEAGRVVRADLLMGERRLKARDYDLQIEPCDLDHQGGDVRPETSLLLVSSARDSYLPLFPLSLFHFQLRSQGVYFLQRPQWQRSVGRRQLRRAGYIAYESGLEVYESGPGEPASLSIERHVGRLESNLGLAQYDSLASPAEPVDDPICDLPEVRLEQEYHLRTFAGREAFLGRIAEWVDDESEGGYLLLLGPPGQGKSALMAELARREQGRRGCLLHMVRSHRNPLKFLPSMISQAARLARSRFGADAYRGDVDDLRNALIGALETVRDRVGKAVVIVDALDELDEPGRRLDFLPEALPSGVRFILTCRPDIPLVKALRARLRSLREWSLEPLTEDDLPAVLGRRLGKPEVGSTATLTDWSGLFRRLQGNPLLIHRALNRIAEAAAEAGRDSRPLRIDIGDYPGTLDDLFRDIYDEIAEKRGSREATPEGRRKGLLLQLLCTAREPIGLGALSELMSELGEPLTQESCRDLILGISQYLLDAGGARFKPWHQGLADFVLDSILGQAGRARIEAIFCEWARRIGPRGGATPCGIVPRTWRQRGGQTSWPGRYCRRRSSRPRWEPAWSSRSSATSAKRPRSCHRTTRFSHRSGYSLARSSARSISWPDTPRRSSKAFGISDGGTTGRGNAGISGDRGTVGPAYFTTGGGPP